MKNAWYEKDRSVFKEKQTSGYFIRTTGIDFPFFAAVILLRCLACSLISNGTTGILHKKIKKNQVNKIIQTLLVQTLFHSWPRLFGSHGGRTTLQEFWQNIWQQGEASVWLTHTLPHIQLYWITTMKLSFVGVWHSVWTWSHLHWQVRSIKFDQQLCQ